MKSASRVSLDRRIGGLERRVLQQVHPAGVDHAAWQWCVAYRFIDYKKALECRDELGDEEIVACFNAALDGEGFRAFLEQLGDAQSGEEAYELLREHISGPLVFGGHGSQWETYCSDVWRKYHREKNPIDKPWTKEARAATDALVRDALTDDWATHAVRLYPWERRDEVPPKKTRKRSRKDAP